MVYFILYQWFIKKIENRYKTEFYLDVTESWLDAIDFEEHIDTARRLWKP